MGYPGATSPPLPLPPLSFPESTWFKLGEEARLRTLAPDEETEAQSGENPWGLWDCYFFFLEENDHKHSQVWWYIPVIPALVRWRQENWAFKASLGHIATWGLRLT